MTARTQSHFPPMLASLVLGFGNMLTPLRRRRTLSQLEQLDDRLLRDIGLTRFDLDAMRRG